MRLGQRSPNRPLRRASCRALSSRCGVDRSPPSPPAARAHQGQTKRGQMEFDLNAASEDEKDAPAETPVHAEVDLPTATATAVEKGAMATHDVQHASGKSAKSDARTARTKASAAVEPAQAPEPAPEAEPTRHAGMIEPSTDSPVDVKRASTDQASGRRRSTAAQRALEAAPPSRILARSSALKAGLNRLPLSTAWRLLRSAYLTLIY